MPGIDYSKWDKLDVSSSDADSDGVEGEEQRHDTNNRKPRTTKLSYPSRVTIGPSGPCVETMPPRATRSPFKASSTWNSHPAHSSPSSSHQSGGEIPSTTLAGSTGADEQLDEDDVLYANLVRGGGCEGDSHLWGQTSDTVTLSVLVPMATRSKHVSHFRLYDEEDQTTHLVKTKIEITVEDASAGSGAVAVQFNQELRYPVKLSEELVDGCWQLCTLPTRSKRLLVIQLFKAPVALGMTLWWDRCLTTDVLSVVDTRTVEGRKMGSTESGEAFQTAWDTAHEEFRRRMKERREKL